MPLVRRWIRTCFPTAAHNRSAPTAVPVGLPLVRMARNCPACAHRLLLQLAPPPHNTAFCPGCGADLVLTHADPLLAQVAVSDSPEASAATQIVRIARPATPRGDQLNSNGNAA